MQYHPTLRVGGAYQHADGSIRVIGYASGFIWKQYREHEGDEVYWFSDGTAAITQWGDLIAPADIPAPVAAPASAPVVVPVAGGPQVVIDWDARTVRIVP